MKQREGRRGSCTVWKLKATLCLMVVSSGEGTGGHGTPPWPSCGETVAGWWVSRYLLLFSFPPTKQEVTQVVRNVSQHLPLTWHRVPQLWDRFSMSQITSGSWLEFFGGGLHPLWTGPRCSTVVRLACIPVRSQLPFRSWPQKALVMCPCACCLWSGLPLSVHLAEIHSSFTLFFGLTTWHVGILVLWPGIEPVPSPAVEAPEVRSLNHWTTREVPHLSFKTQLRGCCREDCPDSPDSLLRDTILRGVSPCPYTVLKYLMQYLTVTGMSSTRFHTSPGLTRLWEQVRSH